MGLGREDHYFKLWARQRSSCKNHLEVRRQKYEIFCGPNKERNDSRNGLLYSLKCGNKCETAHNHWLNLFHIRRGGTVCALYLFTSIIRHVIVSTPFYSIHFHVVPSIPLNHPLRSPLSYICIYVCPIQYNIFFFVIHYITLVTKSRDVLTFRHLHYTVHPSQHSYLYCA